MSFNLINKESWQRREYFEHYYSKVPCTYSMTIKLDITKIIESKQKLYPTMLYLLASSVNQHAAFRTSINQLGQLGIYDEMSPSYTVFHKDTGTFSNLWTVYDPHYETFYQAYKKDIMDYGAIEKMQAKPGTPDNTFPVSMIPWETFEGYNLNLQTGFDYLLPIFTIGKYSKEKEKFTLPLAIQVHHAVCDGFHVCCFINSLNTLIESIYL